MEEEIIGNRWKELDYDGYYLVSFPSHHLFPFRSVPEEPAVGRRNGRRGDEKGRDNRLDLMSLSHHPSPTLPLHPVRSSARRARLSADRT